MNISNDLSSALLTGKAFLYPARDHHLFYFKILTKEDREEIQRGFTKLSKSSVYNRFFSYLKELSEDQLERFTNIDQINQVAWVVMDAQQKDRPGVGVGRYVRSEEDPREAEFALTVIDDYQNKGIGTILLAIIYYIASNSDIAFFTGTALVNNLSLVLRLKALGATITRNKNEYSIKLPVYRDVVQLPDTRYASIVREMICYLKGHHLCL